MVPPLPRAKKLRGPRGPYKPRAPKTPGAQTSRRGTTSAAPQPNEPRGILGGRVTKVYNYITSPETYEKAGKAGKAFRYLERRLEPQHRQAVYAPKFMRSSPKTLSFSNLNLWNYIPYNYLTAPFYAVFSTIDYAVEGIVFHTFYPAISLTYGMARTIADFLWQPARYIVESWFSGVVAWGILLCIPVFLGTVVDFVPFVGPFMSFISEYAAKVLFNDIIPTSVTRTVWIASTLIGAFLNNWNPFYYISGLPTALIEEVVGIADVNFVSPMAYSMHRHYSSSGYKGILLYFASILAGIIPLWLSVPWIKENFFSDTKAMAEFYMDLKNQVYSIFSDEANIVVRNFLRLVRSSLRSFGLLKYAGADGNFSTFVLAVENYMGRLWGNIESSANKANEEIISYSTQFYETTRENIMKYSGVTADMLGNARDKVVTEAKNAAQKVAEKAQETGDSLVGAAQKAGESATGFISAAGNKAADIGANVLTRAQKAGENLVGGASSLAGKASDAVLTGAQAVTDKVLTGAQTASDAVLTGAQNISGKVATTLMAGGSVIAEGAAASAAKTFDTISSTAEQVGQTISSTAGNATETAGKVATVLIPGLIDSIFGYIHAAFNGRSIIDLLSRRSITTTFASTSLPEEDLFAAAENAAAFFDAYYPSQLHQTLDLGDVGKFKNDFVGAVKNAKDEKALRAAFSMLEKNSLLDKFTEKSVGERMICIIGAIKEIASRAVDGIFGKDRNLSDIFGLMVGASLVACAWWFLVKRKSGASEEQKKEVSDLAERFNMLTEMFTELYESQGGELDYNKLLQIVGSKERKLSSSLKAREVPEEVTKDFIDAAVRLANRMLHANLPEDGAADIMFRATIPNMVNEILTWLKILKRNPNLKKYIEQVHLNAVGVTEALNRRIGYESEEPRLKDLSSASRRVQERVAAYR